MRLRALEPTPDVRVLIGACVSPTWRFRTTMSGRYFSASSVFVTLTCARRSSIEMLSTVVGSMSRIATERAPSITTCSGAFVCANADTPETATEAPANRPARKHLRGMKHPKTEGERGLLRDRCQAREP